jgi:RNA polymerase sigma factor for flagellar operon FliA
MVPPIARRLAAKLPSSFELDDLVSAGYLGLIAAADHYQPRAHAGTPFAAFARKRVLGSMLDSIRRGPWTDAVTRVALEAAPELAVSLELEAAIDRSRRAAAVQSAVDTLKPRHRTVIRRHYDGEGLVRVARRLRVSRSRASHMHLAALRSLRVAVAGAA